MEDIQAEMIQAVGSLPDALFEDYWGEVVPKENRIRWWLAEADT
ncbi:MAG: hypothetical protein Q8Q59_15580 [Luteolibacter sp.]|nr:hypothetical protein [Luteolibacter sp.]